MRASTAVIAAIISVSSVCAQTRSLLVLNKEGSVAIVDPVAQRVLGSAPTGGGPHEVVSIGNLAVVSNYGSGRTLSVIDIPSRKEIRRVDVSPFSRPHGLFVSGGMVYFTSEATNEVGRYNPSLNRIESPINTGQAGTHMVAVSPNGAQIYTTNMGSNTVSIFDVTNGRPTGISIPVGSAPEGFDISPDGEQLWAANGGDPTVSIIDIRRKQVVATINVGSRRSNRLKFTPDGKRVLISDYDTGDLLVVDVPSGKVIKRIKIASSIAGILVAPDGTRAYVAATNDNFVAVVDLTKLEVISKIQTGNGPDGMDWIITK
jgi:YVTN family beta-propeller protein